jgi:hypothetical protein
VQSRVTQLGYIIKEFVQPKMSLNNREFIIWKERGRGGRACGWAGQQAGILKVRFQRDRGERQIYRFTEVGRHRNK